MKKRGKKSIRDPACLSRACFPRSRSGQLDLSFGMIFSIILIIAFIAFGFYAITKFIDLQNTIKIESFLKNFQQDVDSMWKSSQGSQVLTYSLPTKISSVCFIDDEFQNLRFMSNEIIQGKMIENLNIANITARENPFCIGNIKGKISLTLAKDFGETLVRVER